MTSSISPSSVVSYFFMLTALSSALYVCFGKNVLNIALSLFVELTSLAGIFLSLGHEYLALIMIFSAILSVMLILAFASVIVGNTEESLIEAELPASAVFGKVAGFFIGISFGALVTWLFIKSGFMIQGTQSKSAGDLGSLLLGDHAVALQLVAISALGLSMGVGVILRGQRP